LFEYKRHARETADVGVAAIENGVDVLPDDIRSWAGQFLRGELVQKIEGVRFIGAALRSGRFGLDLADVEGWAALLRDEPAEGVALGLSARAAGIVPEETILGWQAAGFDGTGPEQEGRYAIALVDAYRRSAARGTPGISGDKPRTRAELIRIELAARSRYPEWSDDEIGRLLEVALARDDPLFWLGYVGGRRS
jgi:hypothetical protein